MSERNEVIFIATIHRMSERIICAINEIQKKMDVRIINFGQISFNTNYDASLNYKEYVVENFSDSSVFNMSKINHRGDIFSKRNELVGLVNDIITDKTVAIIIDDSRPISFFVDVYEIAKSKGIKVFANVHGNYSFDKIPDVYGVTGKKTYDYLFCFGEFEKKYLIKLGMEESCVLTGGIPANDDLKNFHRTNDYILVLPNFVLAGSLPDSWKMMNADVIKKMKLCELQQKIGKKIIFKLKHRMSTNRKQEISHLLNSLDEVDCEILHNIKNENSLIAGASCVLTYGSTMAFKPIQLGIPTVIYKELGYVGNFIEYGGVINFDDSYDYIFEDGFMNYEKDKFLRSTLAGGIDFTSTECYLSSFYERLFK